ncbi:MAG: hypothetical protein A2664_03340 [Candidatus Taylorbacteria bacterium RIFCSPHIGHO2_01_FULL_46_22b]|uniref:M23ase beta-sheet core domain-containing protein n=1 Tax=Candidatus Taylorbacteria bacterium RIFCSPHIGHO2_01_FULL_46_22b TaxID=1802301 RepID=A0A1G2M3E4_9BACT|nr:MAG: hypothetical protein A2664_03340 [Candidatus Taylorbacteria bacterium RIFCSPHIGHO2_01_FULL_46_22b]
MPLSVFAQSPERETELRSLIDGKAKSIADLEAEIEKYQGELKQIGTQKQSLQNEIKSLDITRKKLVADISVTENKISKTSYELEALSIDIKDKETRMDAGREAVAQGLRIIDSYDQASFTERFLAADDFSTVWNDVVVIQDIQEGLHAHIASLGEIKTGLEDRQTESLKIKTQLTQLRNQLANQKKVVEYNTQQKNKLLATTKNNEANYQKLLKEKTALKNAFEDELLSFESELRLITDPSKIPEAHAGALNWPLETIFVTQYFGNTAFAKANPQAYNGQGHNGIDFRASIGTPIKSAKSGEVTGTGDTDAVCAGASYGKWVLIKHDNGLSTLYAHLSVIGVSAGDSVSTGSVIGYSGNTGYSTGPHLHFTVYATQGVQIADRRSRVCGGTYRMPIADLRGYLNPLSYLPPISQ